MARIEVTEESLRAAVPDPVFRHAQDLAGQVTALSTTGLQIEATVDGSAVAIRIRPDTTPDARCACPASPPCAHAIAAALAWVRAATQEDTPEADTPEADDPGADDPGADDPGADDPEADLPALRADFDDILDELADEASECEPGDEWYPDTDDLEDLLDDLEDLTPQTPAAAALTTHVITRIKALLATPQHQGDDLPEALTRAQALLPAPPPT
jgi:hypothetical protein